MASDQSRLKIHIDGDNSGFRKSLRDSEREVIKTVNGAGFGQLASILGAVGLGGALGRGPRPMTRGQMIQQRINKIGAGVHSPQGLGRAIGFMGMGPAASMMRAGMGRFISGSKLAMTGNEWNPLMNQVGATRRERMRHRLDELRRGQLNMGLRMMGGSIAGGVGMGLQSGMSAVGNLGSTLVSMLGPQVLTFLTGGAAVAGITSLVNRVAQNQGAMQKKAMEFSAPVLMEQAMSDLAMTKQAIDIAKNPAYQEQMKRNIESTYKFQTGGVAPSGASVFTEMETTLKNLSSFISDFILGYAISRDPTGAGGFGFAQTLQAGRDAQYAVTTGGIK